MVLFCPTTVNALCESSTKTAQQEVKHLRVFRVWILSRQSFWKAIPFGLTVRNVLCFDSLNFFKANIQSYVIVPELFLSSRLVIYLLLWLSPPLVFAREKKPSSFRFLPQTSFPFLYLLSRINTRKLTTMVRFYCSR